MNAGIPLPWTEEENKLIVSDYFSMLISELNGRKYNKTQHRNELLPLLNSRGPASVEYKHQNISAVLAEMGLPFINGYKPAYNFQRSKLVVAVDRYIHASTNLEGYLEKFSDERIISPSEVDFQQWNVLPPEMKEVKDKISLVPQPLEINYLKREQDNRQLGLQGEQLVFEYERHLLFQAGKTSLAEQVEWVSRDLGDGLGFDILSRNLNGTDKYIEVKTTKMGRDSPFYFSANEYSFSIEKSNSFYLYRVFEFKKSPKMFQLNGRIDHFCRIQPTHYIGRF